MPANVADRNLLFGILALQNGFIDQAALVAAFHAWTTDKAVAIPRVLEDRGVLTAPRRALLEALVDEHVRQHDGDPGQSLAALSSSGGARAALGPIADADLDASLARLGADRGNPLALPVSEAGDGEATISLGAPTAAAGRFRVLRPLARGGLGVVSVALDAELHREVALKSIRDEYADHPEGRARFVLEAEVTGNLEHPGIVPVYGLGHDAHGRPYYAMRFVKGDSLKEAIARFHRDAPGRDPGAEALALQKLLRRFLDVCNAVAYAHDRGVLHRDIKPGNILVGPYGETLVVDWGLAKVVGTPDPTGEATLRPPSASGTGETQPGSALGTPAFMSPEQAAGRLDLLGPASDVYSLGATLYCLLTGRAPFEGDDAAAILRRVQAGDFPPPRRVATAVPRPLEAICLRAMALRPDDRYASPKALADDIERWLADEPVSAYREPPPARLARWGRRHRSLVATAVAILATATAGLAAGFVAINAERHRTELARQAEAEQRAHAEEGQATARDVLRFLKEKVLAAARPEGIGGGLGYDVSLSKALKTALPQVEPSFRGRPLVEASVRTTLGDSFFHLGDSATAERQLRIAREIFVARLGPDHRDTLKCMDSLANSYSALGRHAEAVRLREETLARQKIKLGADDPDTLRSMNNLATSYASLGRHAEAVRLREATLAQMKAKLGADHSYTLSSMHNLANSYAALGRHAEAVKLREETLARSKAKLGAEHPDTLDTMNNLASSYYVLGRHAEALKLYEEGLRLRTAKLGLDHPDTLDSMDNLAIIYDDLGRRAEALQLHEAALARSKAKLGVDHPDTLISMNNLSNCYSELGRHAEALQLREETLARRKAKLGVDHPHTLISMNNLANSYATLGRHAEAVKLREETLARMKAKLGVDHPDTLSSMNNLANSYATLGRHAEALELREETLARRKVKLGVDHPDTLNSMNNLAANLVALDRPAEALPILDECLTFARKARADPRILPFALDLRLRLFAQRKDAAGCRATAEMWEAIGRNDADGLYNSACFRAVTASLLPSGATSADADKAVDRLRRAIAAGFHTTRHRDHLNQDHDLDALRGRADFRRMMLELDDRAFPRDPFARPSKVGTGRGTTP